MKFLLILLFTKSISLKYQKSEVFRISKHGKIRIFKYFSFQYCMETKNTQVSSYDTTLGNTDARSLYIIS